MNVDELEEIFESIGRRFINAEIIYTDNPNVINYRGDHIVMHNLQEFDEDGKLVDVQLRGGGFGMLVQAIKDSQQGLRDEMWQVIGPQVIELQDLSGTELYDTVVSRLDGLGLTDDMTLGDYVEEKLRSGPVGDLPISPRRQETLIERILGIGRGVESHDLPPIADIKKDLPMGVQKRISALGTQTNAMKVLGTILSPAEIIIHDMSVQVLAGLSSVLTGGT